MVAVHPIGDLSPLLRQIHREIEATAPEVVRIACALYDPGDDKLKTFVDSTGDGTALRTYEYHLADRADLSAVGRTRVPAVLADLPHHSGAGRLSSFTVPMVHRGDLLGFVFFDSLDAGTMGHEVVRELLLNAGMITMAMANELMTVASVVSAIQIARDFTQLRDHETAAHMDRMANYSLIVARDTASHFGLTDEQVAHVMLYAPMHDIGKIGIPDRILQKPGALDADEWTIMKSHTTKGAQMVDSMLRDLHRFVVPDRAMLRSIVESHHEKLDGTGYPRGLAGDAVAPAARIVAIADIFDALTTKRSYKATWDFGQAFAELRRMAASGVIDAHCVEALVAAADEAHEAFTSYPDET